MRKGKEEAMMGRRTVLQGMGLAALLGMGAGFNEVAGSGRAGASAGEAPRWSGLARSLREEHAYRARVEGRVPAALRGTLYRNGPGLFERGGLHKRSLLDGDGMVQAFAFGDEGVWYRNRFVRTEKFVAEQEADEYRYATWSTRAPGGMFANLLGRGFHPKGQAGVTVIARNGRVYAFDEGTQPWEIDPATLETIGYDRLGLAEGASVYAAHSKVDARNRDWVHFGLQYGRELMVHFTAFRADGSLRAHWTLPSPRYAYMHDFFVTERHIVLHLHPAEVGLPAFLAGLRSFTDSLSWRPAQGSLWLVLEREGHGAPIRLETEPCWMWHALNAYARGEEIVAEFVGYANPDHFLGEDPAVNAAMEGREGDHTFPGELRRVVLRPGRGEARQEVLDRSGFEFPVVSPSVACHPHRFGYLATETADGFAWNGIARVDMETGRIERFAFPPGQYCGEAMFAPNADISPDPVGGREPGWLLSEVYDGHTGKSFLAILDAERVAEGPLAKVHLEHHVPLSFHGWWQPAA
jgi:all-trans-8'-apo-beta-carotenal 15,15'-oxygenase